QAEPAVHRFYQQQFGARRVENRVDGAQVVATRRGAYFHTVQLRALDTQRTQVTVLTTLLGDGLHRAPAPPSLNLLPVSTVPLSTLETRDGGQAALTLVAANRHSVQANRDHLVDALQAKGFRLQHELDAGPAGPAGVVLVFASSTQEVIVNVREAGEFRSIVIQQMQAAR